MWKIISCVVFALLLTGCNGGGGGSGGGASSSNLSTFSNAALLDSYDTAGDPSASELSPAVSLGSFSFSMLSAEPSEIAMASLGSVDTVSNPEPATMVLFGMCLSWLMLLRRKRV